MAEPSANSPESDGHYEEGEEDDEPLFYDQDELRVKLLQAIEEVPGSGNFSVAQAHAPLPDPGLILGGNSAIEMPISQVDAEIIIDQAHKSPFGKGAQTLVDDTVRKSWELNPNEFSVNDSWANAVNNLLPSIQQTLGLPYEVKNIRAELYKLLIYEEGAFFKSHQDTEKTAGMFGTLMIALPSHHRGGSLLLRQGGRGNVHNTDASSSGYSWAAWYSNVFHEIKPVTEGYRVVLIYNLAKNATMSTGQTLPTMLTREELQTREKIRDLIQLWDVELAHPPSTAILDANLSYLAYRLQHQYTQNSLRLDRLVGDDRERAERLQDVARAVDASVYLCTIEFTETREDDESDDDHYGYGRRGYSSRIYNEISSEMEINNVVSLNGTKILDQISYNESNILGDPREYKEEEAYQKEHEGYTGNAGATATFWYRDTALLIVPPSKTYEFMFTGDQRWRNALSWLGDLKVKAATGESGQVTKLRRLCRFLVSGAAQPLRSASYYGGTSEGPAEKAAKLSCMREIACMSLRHRSLDFFDTVWAHIPIGDLPLEGFYELGCCLAKLGLEQTRTRIQIPKLCREGIGSRYEALKQVRAGFSTASASLDEATRQNCFQYMNVDLLNMIIPASKMFRRNDGVALAKIWDQYAGAGTITREVIEELVFAALTTLQAGFALIASGDPPAGCERPQEKAMGVRSITHFWKTFSLNTADVIQSLGSAESEKVWAAVLRGSTLARLVELTLSDNVNIKGVETNEINALDAIMAKLLNQNASWTAEDLKYTLLPFVAQVACGFVPHLYDPATEVVSTEAKSLAQTVICAYVRKTIGPQPVANHALRAKSCTCRDCRRVNAFLASTTQTTFRLQVDTGRRHHLQQTFNNGATRGLEMDTDRSTYPEDTLVFTNTRERFKARAKEWKAKVDQFWLMIGDIEAKQQANDGLNQLLDDQLAAAIKQRSMAMLIQLASAVADTAAPTSAVTGGQPLQPVAGNASRKRVREGDEGSTLAGPSKRSASGAGRQNEVEVVDLTSD